jgi:hypothetical protein
MSNDQSHHQNILKPPVKIIHKTNSNDLQAFQTISDFVSNLHECFGSRKNKSLNLYYRLISKLSFNDDELILKHIEVFKSFCVKNRKAIINRTTNFASTRIKFSEKIFIDMNYIFNHSDEDTTPIIWEYLLSIRALVDPENKTKELLKQLKKTNTDNPSPENDLIANMFNLISSNMPNTDDNNSINPMEIIGTMMNSNLLGNLMGSMNTNLENGNIDFGKLLNSVQGLVDNVKTELSKSDDPMLKNLMTMIPDLSNLTENASLEEINTTNNFNQEDIKNDNTISETYVNIQDSNLTNNNVD